MCLLVKQPAASKFSDEFLADVFNKNSDGLGVMYAEGGKLHVYKCLPATAQDFVDFYRKHAEDRDCVWHARMQTHGDIDFENCHPYQVTEDVWMAHNGILSTGNNSDKSKSDTWHFIRNFLRPALTANPDLILDDQWCAFVGEMIGRSNKFGFVRSDGKMVIINEQAGVEYQGAWLSNTYAWSYHKFTGTYGGGYTNMYSGYGGYRSRYNGVMWEDDYEDQYGLNPKTTEAKGSYVGGKTKSKYTGMAKITPLTAAQVTPYVKAAYNSWSRRGVAGVEQWVFDAPYKAAALLEYWYDDLDEIADLVDEDPECAAEFISDLFASDSITPSMLN